jgi:hypothetical protein
MTSEAFYGTDYGTNVYVCLYCDAYVGTYGRSNRPMGPLADEPLRNARKAAHSVFDIMWQRGDMTRSQAYRWLAWKMELPPELAHIGMFNKDQCERAWVHSLRFYLTCSELIECPDCNGTGDVGYAVDITDYCPCPRCYGEGVAQRGDMRTL